ncbi:MAG: RNA polymerase sigma factor [Ignavibacteriaceae bacterium]|nr:RNA polymerase sigma factor [Ignavibacteriaceae bacterium]
MKEQKSDKELVEEFLEGDEYSFNLIVHRYRERIYWHARRMTGDHFDADDVVQEVLIVLYKKLKDFRFESGLYTWIYRITATRSINLIKRKNLRRFLPISQDVRSLSDTNNDIVKDIENKEQLKRLDMVLQKLPVKQREVFILRNFDELSYEEIAEITGKSTGGLKANYFHALKKINELMTDENE